MKINKKASLALAGIGLLILGNTGAAWAHVVVKPSDAKTATYQTFTVSVPVEKNSPTVAIKLDIPKSVTYVTPTVKPGWEIMIDKDGTGEDAVVKTLTWTHGSIAVGMRDEFTFSAKTPTTPTDLQWKAYQTYGDGTVVSWDQASGGDEDSDTTTKGSFSVTKVAVDSDQDKALKDTATKADDARAVGDKAFYAAIVGIVAAFVALLLAIRRTTSKEAEPKA